MVSRSISLAPALDEIERLLDGPSFVTVHTLRLDPRWDPIREYPRFKALLVKCTDLRPTRGSAAWVAATLGSGGMGEAIRGRLQSALKEA